MIPMDLRKILARYLSSASLVWLLSAWIAVLVSHQEKARFLAQAAACLGLGLLFYPGWGKAGHRAGLLAWCALAAGGLFVQIITANMLDAASIKLVVGVFLLGLFMHGLIHPFSSQPDAPFLGLCLFATLAALPLWLGPWMEMLAEGHPRIFQALLWLCPLSYLGGLFDYDFLREQWFYRNTPFGMLRYDYPDPAMASLLFIASNAWLLFHPHRLKNWLLRLHLKTKSLPS